MGNCSRGACCEYSGGAEYADMATSEEVEEAPEVSGACSFSPSLPRSGLIEWCPSILLDTLDTTVTKNEKTRIDLTISMFLLIY